MNEKEKEFLKAIRAIVKKEITMQLEDFKHDVKKLITEQNSSGGDSALSFLYDSPTRESAPSQKPKKTYVKDSFLNDILNDVGPLSENISARDMVSYDRETSSAIITGINGEHINPKNEEVKKVIDITQRDYSKLLNKMKEKTGRV